ncbi:MAG: outer membrane protein assembly factor BamA [bacterium]|nr:outer membrane protein assembly factor BamA [bacterium]
MTNRTFWVIALAFGVIATSATGQEPAEQTIKDVRLDGLETYSEQLVRSQLEVKPGESYNPRAVARDIRRLYDLGFFSLIKADAAAEDGQIVLTYIVEEKRLIDEIKIIGNDKLRDRHVRAVLTWREGDSFVAEAYDEERDAILQLYQSKGFPNAAVGIVVEESATSRVRITYQIDEGKKARIKRIRFEGNDALSRRRLNRLMTTNRSWWLFGGKYDEEKFNADLESILDTYGDYGRLEADIPRTDFDYRKGGKGLNLTIHLAEGPEYTVGALEIADNLVFDDDEIQRLLKIQPGDVHNKSQVRKDAEFVQKGHSDSGYVDALVTPQVTLDRDTKTTHIVQRIDEGNLKYLREIKVTGNSITRDDVIRREILMIPGERFDGTLLEASQRRIEATEYFDSVRFNLEDALDQDQFSNLLVDVEEGKTSFWNFGFGYSTEEAFNAYTELRFRNFDIKNPPSFSGGGQQLRLRLNLGQRRTQYFLSFTDPEIAGRPLALGFDIFDESYSYQGGTNYTEESQGFQVRMGKMLSPYVNVRTMLRYRNVSFTESDWQQFSAYEAYRGDETTVSSVWGINRSTVDSRRDPTRGSTHDLELEVAGLIGDNQFLKLEHDSVWYKSFGEEDKWVLSFRTREGVSLPYGDTAVVPLSDRFFAGGTNSVRGYDLRDIGPQVPQYNIFGIRFGESVRVGGEAKLINNLELKYKLNDMLRLYAFSDAGGIWEEPSAFDIGDMRYSVGFGFGVDVPRLGPIRVDYGFPLNPDGDQGSGRLHLQTGFNW